MSEVDPFNTPDGMHGINRPRKSWPVATRRALRLPTGGFVYDFLGGAARLAIWVVLWLIMMATFAGRLERPQPLARREPVTGSESIVGRSRASPPGQVDLDARCVLGEEVEVLPPLEWRRP